MNRIVRIGTRESRLAVIQAEMVADAIRETAPEIEVQLVTMKTTGDKILDRTLDKVGGKGLFVKELDEALRRGEVDLCAHSYKDMPAGEDFELPVVAVSPREDPRDVLILAKGANALNPGLPVGCASQRRQQQVRKLYPGQPVAPVRGNVLTRLEKLDRGEYAALVLAAAGIKRLSLWDRVSRALEPEELLPCGCQGIIAVQGRAGEDYSYLSGFHNEEAATASTAERAFIDRLNCGCGAPVGVYAKLIGGTLRIRGMIGNNGDLFYDEIIGNPAQARAMGMSLAETLIQKSGVEW